MESAKPTLIVFAGPNGSGKTTLAKKLLEKPSIEFINADVIARDLDPVNFNSAKVNIRSARISLEKINQCIDEKKSFAFETVLPTPNKFSIIDKAIEKGYQVHIRAVFVSNVRISKERVADRVQKNGHSIPDEVIERRYPRSIKNLTTLMARNDLASIGVFNNDNPNKAHKLVFFKKLDKVIYKGISKRLNLSKGNLSRDTLSRS